MKTMGLLAGMSWESSSVYYQLINRGVQKRLGGVHSAKILMYSFDFGEVSRLQQSARWDEATALLAGVGRDLAKGGSDFVAICCNTMHLMADAVEKAAGVPLLHIADPLGEAAKKAGMTKLGLIGTRFTMDEPGIIADRLRKKFGLEVIVPGQGGARYDRRHHPDRIGEGHHPRRIPRALSRGDGRSGGARLPGHHPGLHGNPAPGEPGGFHRAALRHDAAACRRDRGFCAGLNSWL